MTAQYSMHSRKSYKRIAWTSSRFVFHHSVVASSDAVNAAPDNVIVTADAGIVSGDNGFVRLVHDVVKPVNKAFG
jgi:hypothetical protein